MVLFHEIESAFQVAVQYGILLLECIGVAVLMVTALRSVVGYLRKSSQVRLTPAEGIALALEFKLGGEVLRTVIVGGGASWQFWGPSSFCAGP